jgi:hypothetical protein
LWARSRDDVASSVTEAVVDDPAASLSGDTRPNLVVSKVGDGDRICLYSSSPTHLVVDFEGWFSAS